MADFSEQEAKVLAALHEVNESWLTGRPDSLANLVADGIVMMLPDFSGSIVGRQAFVEGFRDFCHNARIHTHTETDYHVHVFDGTAVASFRFDMTYERDGRCHRSTGRDLWVFEAKDAGWIAVWRTMLDTTDEPLF